MNDQIMEGLQRIDRAAAELLESAEAPWMRGVLHQPNDPDGLPTAESIRLHKTLDRVRQASAALDLILRLTAGVTAVTPRDPAAWEQRTAALAARRIGITAEVYLAHRRAGLRWCSRCKAWHPRRAFARRVASRDGCHSVCTASWRQVNGSPSAS